MVMKQTKDQYRREEVLTVRLNHPNGRTIADHLYSIEAKHINEISFQYLTLFPIILLRSPNSLSNCDTTCTSHTFCLPNASKT